MLHPVNRLCTVLRTECAFMSAVKAVGLFLLRHDNELLFFWFTVNYVLLERQHKITSIGFRATLHVSCYWNCRPVSYNVNGVCMGRCGVSHWLTLESCQILVLHGYSIVAGTHLSADEERQLQPISAFGNVQRISKWNQEKGAISGAAVQMPG